MHFIFRIADGVVLYTPATDNQRDNEWAACLANEGGVADDYIVVEAPGPIPNGMMPELTCIGGVTFVPNPARVAREAAVIVVSEKMKSWGLTDADLEVLGIMTKGVGG